MKEKIGIEKIIEEIEKMSDKEMNKKINLYWNDENFRKKLYNLYNDETVCEYLGINYSILDNIKKLKKFAIIEYEDWLKKQEKAEFFNSLLSQTQTS